MDTMTFDGDTDCPSCGRRICGYCQGKETQCEGAHAEDCKIDEGVTEEGE